MAKKRKAKKGMSTGIKWIITFILFITAIATVIVCAKSGAFHFEAGKVSANDNDIEMNEKEQTEPEDEENEGETEKYTVFVTAGNGGTANPSGSVTVDSWDSISLSFTPDEGYEIESVTLDGEELGAVDDYTLSYIDSNHTIVVTFAEKVVPTPDPDASIDEKIADGVVGIIGRIIDEVTSEN